MIEKGHPLLEQIADVLTNVLKFPFQKGSLWSLQSRPHPAPVLYIYVLLLSNEKEILMCVMH